MRPLSDVERHVLDLMLALDFPGAAELRVQAESAQVVRRCDCGCATIDLAVADDVPLAVVTSRTPVNADVDDLVGGGLIVFVDEGRLSCLEIYAAEDPVPREFPGVDRIRPYV